eukprot:9477831-Pyramimonas_sp.AAC.1
MDGFETNEGVIVLAATNLPETLDAALTRPGRFDRHVTVPNPVSHCRVIADHLRLDARCRLPSLRNMRPLSGLSLQS